MRQHRIVFLVVLIVVAALAAGYLIGRAPQLAAPVAAKHAPDAAGAPLAHSTRTRTAAISKTVTKTPSSVTAEPALKDVYADLKRRADANDAAAASELYLDLRRCSFERILAASLPRWAREEFNRDTSGDSEEQMRMHERALDSLQKQIDYVQRYAPFCDSAGPEILNQLAPVSLQAAQLGDPKALRCYVSGALLHFNGVLDHPEWLTAFKQNAVPLAETGFRNGDWSIVTLYGNAYGQSPVSGLFGQAVGGDPAQAYQYLKLQQLGASGEHLNRIAQQVGDAAVDLSPDQIAQGDAWAQDMYSRYFDGTSSNPTEGHPCGDGFD